jgi:hypothetical protein
MTGYNCNIISPSSSYSFKLQNVHYESSQIVFIYYRNNVRLYSFSLLYNNHLFISEQQISNFAALSNQTPHTTRFPLIESIFSNQQARSSHLFLLLFCRGGPPVMFGSTPAFRIFPTIFINLRQFLGRRRLRG